MTITKCGEKVFKKITNDDIYEKLCNVEKHVITTNGKVKLNWWMASTALGLTTSLLLVLVSIKLLA